MLNWFRQAFKINSRAESAVAQKNSAVEAAQNTEAIATEVAYKNQGDAFLDQSDWVNAAKCYQQAVANNPDYADAQSNLGLALAELRQYEDALKHLKQAVSLNQTAFNAYYILGTVARHLGKLDEAVEYFWKAVAIKPDFAEALDYLGFLLRERGELRKSIDCYRKALAINPLSRETHSSLLLALQYDETLTQEDLHVEHLRFAERFEKPLAGLRQIHLNEKSLDRRLKIGYVSPDFCRHSVALFMMPVLLNHDKERFEISCYYNNATSDDFTAQFVSAADRFIPCATMSDDELCALIRADGIDILIDLTGHTAHNRLLTFALKPAPVQMTYLGYPGTSGLSTIDYRLTDSYTNPEGSDRYYTEQLLRLPDSMWCYRPAENMQEITPLPALKNGYLTFGSFNSINKVGNDCIALWADLLRTLPTSRLLIATVPEGEIRQRLSRQLLEYGISSDRIRFVGTLPKYEFQQMLQQVDISLDPFPINGATTTCESLWLGVPVLTLIGNRFLSRAGLSVLSAARLPEFAAATREEYLKIAISMANDLPRLDNMRSAMRDHLMASPLLDVKKFTRNLEGVYRNAWITWCNTRE